MPGASGRCKDLTPELSRTALRPGASENYQNLHEAAKRARLERIVRPHRLQARPRLVQADQVQQADHQTDARAQVPERLTVAREVGLKKYKEHAA